MIGKIHYNATCLKNIKCTENLSYAEYLKLSQKKKSKHRFYFDLLNVKLALLLERLFLVLEGIIRGWAIKDYPLIGDMITTCSNLEVGNKHGKNRSQIWKRRKHLLIDEYNAQKMVILDLIEKV